jgi:hypothetical protein
MVGFRLVTPYSRASVYQRSGRTHCLHFQQRTGKRFGQILVHMFVSLHLIFICRIYKKLSAKPITDQRAHRVVKNFHGLYLHSSSTVHLRVSWHFRNYRRGVDGMNISEFESFTELCVSSLFVYVFPFFPAAVNVYWSNIIKVMYRYISDVHYDSHTVSREILGSGYSFHKRQDSELFQIILYHRHRIWISTKSLRNVLGYVW